MGEEAIIRDRPFIIILKIRLQVEEEEEVFLTDDE